MIFFACIILLGVVLGLYLKILVILYLSLCLLLLGWIVHRTIGRPSHLLQWLLVLIMMTGWVYIRTEQDRLPAHDFQDRQKHWAWIAIQSTDHITTQWQSYRGNLKIMEHQAYDIPITINHYGPDPHVLTPSSGWLWITLKRIKLQQAMPWMRERVAIKADWVMRGAMTSPQAANVLQHLKHWRQNTIQLLWARAGPNDTLAILIALAFGDRAYLSNPIWQVFSRTGTAHLLAIAGLHLGVVVTLSVIMIGAFWRRQPACVHWVPMPMVSVIVGACSALVYAIFTGFEIPCQRASIMLIVMALSYLLQWNISITQRLLLAFIGIIMIYPASLLSASLWLSFSAVISICYAMQTSGYASRFRNWSRLSLVISLAVLPWSLYFFGQYAVIGIVANAIAIPWMAFCLVPLCLCAIISGLLSFTVSTVLWHWAIIVFHPLWYLLKHMAAWPYASIYCHPNIIVMLCYSMSYVWLFAPKAVPGRYYALVGMLPLILTTVPVIPIDGAMHHQWHNGQISWTSTQTRQYHLLTYQGRGSQDLTQWVLKAIAAHDGFFMNPYRLVVMKQS